MRRVDHIGSRNLQVSLRNGGINVVVTPRATDGLHESCAIFGKDVCGSAFVYRVAVEEFVRFSDRRGGRPGCGVGMVGKGGKGWEG